MPIQNLFWIYSVYFQQYTKENITYNVVHLDQIEFLTKNLKLLKRERYIVRKNLDSTTIPINITHNGRNIFEVKNILVCAFV